MAVSLDLCELCCWLAASSLDLALDLTTAMQRSSSIAAAQLGRTLTAHAAPAAPARLFSSSSSSPARSTANRPKRDPTSYGLGGRVPRKDWPAPATTDTANHPLWRFFHDQQPLEAPDKRVDYSSASSRSLSICPGFPH